MKNTFFITTVLIIIFFSSCQKDLKKTSKIEELKKCVCIVESKPPPPIEGKILSFSKLEITEENKKYFVTVKLIADKLVNYNGIDQQIFKIATNNKNQKKKFYFALPVNFNKYWNEMKIFTNKNNTILEIGFKGMKISKIFYKLYSYKYVNEDFGDGNIVVKSTLVKYDYEIIK